jgi:hypothetical protein
MWLSASENGLVLEEEYMGRRWLVLVALIFAAMGLAPGIGLWWKEGTFVGFGIACCMVVFIFYVPFLLVLTFSRYRRVVIDRTERVVEAQVIFRLLRPRITRVSFDAVREVVCRRVPDSEGADGMRIWLVARDGAEVPLIKRAAWSDDVFDRLREIFGEIVRAV